MCRRRAGCWTATRAGEARHPAPPPALLGPRVHALLRPPGLLHTPSCNAAAFPLQCCCEGLAAGVGCEGSAAGVGCPRRCEWKPPSVAWSRRTSGWSSDAVARRGTCGWSPARVWLVTCKGAGDGVCRLGAEVWGVRTRPHCEALSRRFVNNEETLCGRWCHGAGGWRCDDVRGHKGQACRCVVPAEDQTWCGA